MNSTELKLIIAGWIHDLGKLAYRGGENRNKEGLGYNVAHSELLVELFEELEANDEWKHIAKIASYHHQKDYSHFKNELNEEDRFIAWCIYMADNISAKERNEKDEGINQQTRKQPIVNVFTMLFDRKDYSYFDANTIDKVSVSSGNSDNSFDFRNLFNDFKEEFKNFLKDNEKITEKTIYQLDVILQKYLTFVPSDAYENIPDISLYDHSKTVTAFAKILYEFYKNEHIKHYEKKPTDYILNKIKVSLIGVDFPSIQNYIFNGIKKTKSITKRLRARSFLVQLIQEAVLEYTLNKLNLTRANVLISAGGKFIILSPKIHCETIKELRKNINGYFIKNYPGIRLSINSFDTLLTDVVYDFKGVYEEISNKLSSTKFKTYENDNLKSIFNFGYDGSKVLCDFCGINYFDDEKNDKCDFCEKEIVLGGLLVKDIKDKGISFDYIDENGNFKFDLGIEVDGSKGNLVDKKFNIIPNKWDFDKINYGIVKSLNLYVPYEGIGKKVLSKEEAYQNSLIHSISGKNNKKTVGEVKEFSDILKDTNSTYLVMVKGDVDNMGLILKYGFGESGNYSLSRVLTFSRLLELFFGYRLQCFLEENFENVYTIYSGGDDFVFICPFNDLNKFVSNLYSEFWDFTHNKNIHFSLGIGILKDKTPINQVFKNTEELLDTAKKTAKEKMKYEVNNNFKKEKIDGLEDIDKFELQVLRHFGICAFEKDNLVLDKKTNLFEESKNLKDKKSLRYKLYQGLKEALNCLENCKWGDYVLVGARIIYLLHRNLSKTPDNKRYIDEFVDLFKNFKDKNNLRKKKEKIRKYLLELSYSIYLDR